jgi:erythromycin esterase-like protein
MSALGKSLAIVLVLSLAPHAEAARKPPRPPRPTGDPVLPGIWRLQGNDPALSQDDLEPLRQVIGTAPIVGLGESFHTSGGYYRMKHRVFRFLVEKMGFRAFAFETPWVGADRVAAYVQTCEGTPEEALQGVFGVWRSAEVRDLVQWMCEWNRTHRRPKDRLYFYGFDIQAESRHHAPALLAFLSRVGIGEDDPRVSALVGQCDGIEQTIYPRLIPDDRHQRCTEALQEIDRFLAENEQALVRRTSKADLAWARVRLVALRAWEDEAYYNNRNLERLHAARDGGMAYTLLAIRSLRFPQAKTAVWAHNFHLARDFRTADGPVSMGTYLDQALGSSYVNLALAAFEVSIDWPAIGCGPIAPPPSLGSTERKLHSLDEDYLLVDLRFPGGDPPFLHPDYAYPLGGDLMIPHQQFNGILYLNRSPKMTPLTWPSCQ